MQVQNFMHFNYTFQSLWQQPTVATSTTTASVAAAISNLESRLAAATSAAESSTPAAVVNSIEHTSSTPTAVVAGALGVAVEDGPASTLNVERRESHAQDVSMTSEPVSRANDNLIHAAIPASGPTSFDGAATSTPRTEHVNHQVFGQKNHFPNNNALIEFFNFICACVATQNILLIEYLYQHNLPQTPPANAPQDTDSTPTASATMSPPRSSVTPSEPLPGTSGTSAPPPPPSNNTDYAAILESNT